MRGLRAPIISKNVSPESMEKVVKLLRIDPLVCLKIRGQGVSKK